MTKALPLALALMLVVSPVLAQDKKITLGDSSGAAMGQLIAEGYEIKASVPNGKSVIILLQKDTNAYACEMVSLTRSLCGKIN